MEKNLTPGVFDSVKIEAALAFLFLLPVLLLTFRLSPPWDMLIALAYGGVSAGLIVWRVHRKMPRGGRHGHE